jgi:hypothetical protein
MSDIIYYLGLSYTFPELRRISGNCCSQRMECRRHGKRKGSGSFLKKRTKKLLLYSVRGDRTPASTGKSFLLLFS